MNLPLSANQISNKGASVTRTLKELTEEVAYEKSVSTSLPRKYERRENALS